jgi:hypothetical protein
LFEQSHVPDLKKRKIGLSKLLRENRAPFDFKVEITLSVSLFTGASFFKKLHNEV